MRAYLDESGDTGFRFGPGRSTAFLVIAIVVVDNPEPLAVALQQLRQRLGRPNLEFKFSSCSDEHKDAFFRAITGEPFIAYCRVLDKRRLQHRPVGHDLYLSVVRAALTDATDELVNATLVIDESFQSKQEQRRFAAGVRQPLRWSGGGEGIIGRVLFRRSRSEDLLQVTDMVAGAVARSFEKGRPDFVGLIPAHRLHVKVMP